MIPLNDPRMLTLARSDNPPVFIHPQALVETSRVGAGTRVWAFAHVCSGAVVGRDCNICDHTFIEQNARVGDRVTLKCGVYLWAGTVIEDDVFIGPNVSFTNDRYPRSRQTPSLYEGVTIRRGASIGAGAVLLPGVEVGEYAMVGAGSIVTTTVPPHALVYGQPARVVAQVCIRGHRLSLSEEPHQCLECNEEESAQRWAA